jgi:hypothetical protein
MAQSIVNILSQCEIQHLCSLPEVSNAKEKLDAYTMAGVVYFSIPLTTTIRDALTSRFRIDLSNITKIPMRWIKGDTAPHVDVGAEDFENTYLMYLSDSPGELILDNVSYPIATNTAYIFNEGILHKTSNTENVPRLMIGPMNEYAEPVGFVIRYYPTQADALAITNQFPGSSSNSIVGSGGPYGGFTSWRIASNSTGSSSQTVVYMNGDSLNFDGSYYLYPTSPCFLEGTKILCLVAGVEKYIPIEHMKNGTLVKTLKDGYKKVELIGKGEIQNPDDDEYTENRLYNCSPIKYPELNDELYITGCHSILVDKITDEQRNNIIKQFGKVYVTNGKFRLMSCLDERAKPWNSLGSYTIWHFALEHTDISMNYGVYANGLLVETCCIRFMRDKSNMRII